MWMKPIDWQTIYGKETEAFQQLVTDSLQQETEVIRHPRVHRRVKIVLVAAVILLLATTAFAAIRRAGLMDFFSKWINYSETVGYPMTSSSLGQPLLTESFEGLTIEVIEFLNAEDAHYFVTTVALQPGIQGIVRSMDEFLNGADAQMPLSDVPAYYVHHEMQHETGGAITFDFIQNEDGSVSFFSDPSFFTMADTARMICDIQVRKVEPGERPQYALAMYDANTQEAQFNFLIPMPQSIDTRITTESVFLDGADIQVDTVFLKQTEKGIICAVYFSRKDGIPLTMETSDRLQFFIKSASGVGFTSAPLEIVRYHAGYYTAMARLDGESLPDQITLIVKEEGKEQSLVEMELLLEQGSLDTEKLMRYAPL